MLPGEQWNDIHKMLKLLPPEKIKISKLSFLGRHSDFMKEAKKCRLIIHTHDTITFQETIVGNLPTIAIWDPNIERSNKVAKEYYNKMKELGMVHNSYKSASDFINNNYFKIEVWWNSKEVQNLRKRYCKNLAYTNKKMVHEWISEIKDQIKKYSIHKIK